MQGFEQKKTIYRCKNNQADYFKVDFVFLRIGLCAKALYIFSWWVKLLGLPIALQWLLKLTDCLNYPHSIPIYLSSTLGWMIDYLSTIEMT